MKVCAICGTRYEGDYCPECGNGPKRKQTINYDFDIELAEQGLVPFAKKKKQITVWLLIFGIPIAVISALLLFEKITDNMFGADFSFYTALVLILVSFVGLIGLIVKLYTYKDLQPRGHLRAIKTCFAKIGIGSEPDSIFIIEDYVPTDIGTGFGAITLLLFFLPVMLSYIIVLDSAFTLLPTVFQIFKFAKHEKANNGRINLKKLKHSNKIIMWIAIFCAVVFVAGNLVLGIVATQKAADNNPINNKESSVTENDTKYDAEVIRNGALYSLLKEETEDGETEYYYSVRAADDENEKPVGNVEILADIDGVPVITIEEKGFCGCTGITSVVIPDSIIEIGKEAFAGCSQLQSYTAPFVGLSAESEFEDAVLGSVFGWENVVGIYATGGEKYAANKSTDDAPEGAVWQITVCTPNHGWDYHCYYIPSSLTTVSITKQDAIPDYAFNGCESLRTINLVSGSTLGEYALQNCSATVNK